MEILLQIITIVCGLIGAIAVIIDIATSPKKKSFFNVPQLLNSLSAHFDI